MRKVIFSSFNFSPAFLGPTLNMLQESLDNGDEVHYITCLKSFKTCGFNTFNLKYMCDLCEYRYDTYSKELEGNFTLRKLNELWNDNDHTEAEEFIAKQGTVTKKTLYNGFDVGESVFSSYISKTRDRDLEVTENEKVISELGKQAIVVYRSIKRFLIEHKIQEVLIFNGRWDYYRAAFRAAQDLNIPCLIYENFRSGGFIELFDNSFPHSIQQRQMKFDQCWDQNKDEEEKKRIAADFFKVKEKGEVFLKASHVENQKKAFLPDYIDPNKEIFALYNSSDDEFAAVGGDEFKNPLFKDQPDGLHYVAKLVNDKFPDAQLVIRMHPNLKGLDYDYLKPIYDLEDKYPNVFLIKPEDKTDTYALLSVASKVLVFGSTIGVEASYRGKEVILLAKTFYFNSDVAHIPKDKSEIETMLKEPLSIKPRENCEKIGYYFLTGGVKAKYYDFEYGGAFKFKNKDLTYMPFIRKNYFRLQKLLKL